MGKKFYISDTHWGHNNVLAFDQRPFKTVEEMDAELIRRWNSVVDPGDIVYILGDMFWMSPAKAKPIMEQLNGQKFLVKGNHDRWHDTKFDKLFVKIDEYMEEYIKTQPNAKELEEEFKTIKQRSQIQKSPYQYVLSWFEAKFDGYNDLDQFMAEKEAERKAKEAEKAAAEAAA